MGGGRWEETAREEAVGRRPLAAMSIGAKGQGTGGAQSSGGTHKHKGVSRLTCGTWRGQLIGVWIYQILRVQR